MTHRDEEFVWLNDDAYKFLRNNQSYIRDGETVAQRVEEISRKAFKEIYPNEDFYNKFIEYVKRGFISLSTPVWANYGRKGLLSISCFGSVAEDSMDSILTTASEVGMMSKYGGGTSIYLGNLRGRGSKISKGGKSDGSFHFAKLFDTIIDTCHQAGTRRGAAAVYLDIDHADIEEFLTIKHEGSPVQNLFSGVSVSNEWLEDMEVNRDPEKLKIWAKLLQSRQRVGIPYVFFKTNVNENKPLIYKETNSEIVASNLCFVGSDRVVSSRGYLTAKELNEQGGDLILFDGHKQVNASEMILRERNVPVYKVTLGNGMEHTITDYHALAKHVSRNKIERVPLKDLKIGDRIAIQTEKGLFGEKDMQDEAFLLGLYQSDGTQHKDRIMLDLWENDFDLVDEINTKFSNVFYKYKCDKYVIENKFGKGAAVRSIKPPKLTEVKVVQSKVRKMRLASNALKKSLNFEKGYVPNWIWESNEKTQWEYVRGLLYTDGTVFRSNGKGTPIQISYADINREFLKDLQKLFNNLGLKSSIRLLKEAGVTSLPDGKGGYKDYNTKTCYRLIVGNKNDALTIEKNTKFLSRKNIDLEDRVYNDSTKKHYEITSIEFMGNEDVYCPTVYTDEHVFIVNGIKTFNCNEIMLVSNEKESFVCCLSSLNAERFDEWIDTDVVEVLTSFLDTVITDFISVAKDIPFLDRAVAFSKRHRALGLGVLGYHSYLQKNMIAFESLEAKSFNSKLFKTIKKRSYEQSIKLGEELGFAPIFDEVDTKDVKRRNVTTMAIAPTSSSSFILGQVSQGIEPLRSNYYIRDVAQRKIVYKNPHLEKLLESKGFNTKEVWEKISLNFGSVRNLEELTDHEKDVFKTFSEISQMEVLIQASQRQKYIDQGQSLNLMIHPKTPTRDVNALMMYAYKNGIKSLYYQHSISAVQEFLNNTVNCVSCEA